MFEHIDKNVFALVEDKDILAFQSNLSTTTGETSHPFLEESTFLQNFVGNTYFAKRVVPMIPHANMNVPRERTSLEIPKASLFRDAGLPSLCNTER
jgi:hypothetical protein